MNKPGQRQWTFSGNNSVEVQPDFRELLALLNKHAVEHLVVGGYALAFHGAPRFTGDLDRVLSPRGNA